MPQNQSVEIGVDGPGRSATLTRQRFESAAAPDAPTGRARLGVRAATGPPPSSASLLLSTMVLSLPGRFDVYRAWPDLYEAILAMTLTAMRRGLDRRTVELINVRGSHLAVVAAWRDTPWFPPDERSILALRDATVVAGPIDEQVGVDARERFGDDGLAKLLLAIVAIIAWNRVNVAAGIEPIDP
jgi:hypothetical protein